jgi:hypothetical protein
LIKIYNTLEKTENNEYIYHILVNNNYICHFKHNPTDGLGICLFKASKSIINRQRDSFKKYLREIEEEESRLHL